MCEITEKEALWEMKRLFGQEELNDDDVERWRMLSQIAANGNFVDELLTLLDQDKELTTQLRCFMNTTGINLQEIILGGVALGVYILERLLPHDCGWDMFGKFWCDVCMCNETSCTAIDYAINRALDKMIADLLLL